jgi:hypothetical protein
MSIKTRSGRIALPEVRSRIDLEIPSPPYPPLPLRWARGKESLSRRSGRGDGVRVILSIVALALLVTSCSSGSAADARRDMARDAGLKDRLAAEQATRVVERFFPATATPGPTRPPPPALRDLAITFGFRADGNPDGSYASVPAGAGTAYAAARLVGISQGQVARAVVTDGWGNEIANPAVTIDPGPSERWLALPIPLPAELTPGQYGVFVFVDDQPLGSLAFGVTGVGSSAQLLPEAPANPRLPATLPPPGIAPITDQPTATALPG